MDASDEANARQAELFVTLQQLLAISAVELAPALGEASYLIARALGADAVDVFLYDGPTDSLVRATTESAMAAPPRGPGPGRLPMAKGGLTVRVFRNGKSARTGNVGREWRGRPGIAGAPSARSAIVCRLPVDGEVRGVLRATSGQPDRFSEDDLRFLETVAQWVSLVVRRAELVAQIARDARQEDRRMAADELRRLTRREQEVVILIASGLTNDAIAVRLVVVRGTVSNHVERILRKLGFSRRTQIASWAAQNGFWTPDTSQTDST